MIILKMAFKNLLRTPVRTLVNSSIIIAGFSALVIFKGFSSYVLRAIETASTQFVYGHIQIGTKEFWDALPVDTPKDRLLTGVPQLVEKLKALPEVSIVGPRLNLFSLVAGNERSVSAQGWGLNPELEVNFSKELFLLHGKPLKLNSEKSVILGSGLAEALNVKVGESVSIVSQTIDGAANAVDPEVIGIFQTGFGEVDNSTYVMPLQLVQTLMDTEQAEKIVILLKDRDTLLPTFAKIQEIANAQGFVAKLWTELAKLYRQVDAFYRVQNRIFTTILMGLILLGISNTIGISIFERTGEIGTMRALGDSETDVMQSFLLESLVLATLSSILAVPINILMIKVINAAQILIEMPNSSRPMPIAVDMMASNFVLAFVTVTLTTVIATLLPAWNASRIPIVDALRKL